MRVRDIRWTYAATVVVFLVSVSQYYHRNTGFTDLINFGDRFEERRLPAVLNVPHYVHYQSDGYDGQCYAQMAVDPLLRDPDLGRALDSAPYRARRILFSWTAYLLGLGRPAWIIKAYAVQNIIAWLLLAWVLLRWFPPSAPRNVLPWIGCLFGVGLIYSVRFALLDGPGLLLVALGVAAMERGRPWLASGLMALVGLGRESNLISGGLLMDRVPRHWRDAVSLAVRGLVAVLPLLAWLLYVRWVFGTTAASDATNFAMPFSGYFSKWSATIAELQSSGWFGSWARFNLAALVSLTVQAAYLLARRDWASPWWRVGIAYCALMPFLATPVWEGDPGAITRVVVPMHVAFNVLVLRSRYFWPLVVAGNLTVFHGINMINVPGLGRMF